MDSLSTVALSAVSSMLTPVTRLDQTRRSKVDICTWNKKTSPRMRPLSCVCLFILIRELKFCSAYTAPVLHGSECVQYRDVDVNAHIILWTVVTYLRVWDHKMLYFFTSARAYFSVSLYHSNFRQAYHTKIRSEMLILKVNPLNQPNLLSVVCVLLCVDINAHINGHFFSFLFYFLVVDIYFIRLFIPEGN